MKKIGLYILLIFILSQSQVLSQPVNNVAKAVVMATPNAAALGKYGDIPISLNTGVPNIDIPVYTLQEGALSLPISISYHASGIKLGEPVSWIGTGWSLNAGGIISRTVQGRPDEDSGYYLNGTSVTWPPTGLQLQLYGDGASDPEPDIFSFNVGGYVGKFFFDQNQQVNLVPKQDLKVSWNHDATSKKFTWFCITTPDGTRYYFGSFPGDTGNNALEETSVDDPSNLSTGSWYLRRIMSQDGFDIIDLNYVNEDYSYKAPGSCEHKVMDCASGQSNISNTFPSTSVDPNHYYNRILVKGKRLSSITTSTLTATFTPTTAGRGDLEGYPPLTTLPKALDKITIQQTSSYCTNFQFTYDYFIDASHNTIPEGKRLRLNQVKEISCDGTLSKEPYVFTYQGNDVKWRLSHAIDHWGFYNGAGNNETSPFEIPSGTTVVSNGQSVSYGTADRESNENFIQDGVLTQIKYPTGGNTQFTYETNDYPTTQTVPTTTFLVQISNCTVPTTACCGTQTTETTRSFTATEISTAQYRLGLYNIPFYNGGTSCSPATPVDVTLQIYQMPANTLIGTNGFNLPGTTGYGELTGAFANLATFQAGVSYKFKITVRNGKGLFDVTTTGQITSPINKKVGGLRIKQVRTSDGVNAANDIIRSYQYRQLADTSRSSGQLYYTPLYGYGLNGNPGLTYAYFRSGSVVPMSGFENYHIGYAAVTETLNGNGKVTHQFITENMQGTTNSFPAVPEPVRLENGNELRSDSYDASGNQLAWTSNTRKFDTYVNPPGNRIKVIPVSTGCSGLPTIYAYSNPYTMRTRHFRWQQVDAAVDGLVTSTTYNYEASNTYAPPVDMSTVNSDGKTTRTEYKYPWNTTTTTGAVKDSLLRRNIIGSPLETYVKVNNVQVDGSRVNFAVFRQTDGVKVTPGTVSVNPYPWTFDRYEVTWDANGVLQTGAWVTKDTIGEYYGSTASVGKGLPKWWAKTNWPREIYDWETGGLLKKRTYLNFIKEYTWNTGTRLLQKAKEIDGQETWYDFDKLSRLSKVWARPTTAGTKTSANITTDYTYQYKNASNTYNYVKTKTTYTPVSGSAINIQEAFQYLDGLGRPWQTVGKQQSPASLDVVSAVEYDNQGRVGKKYNPFESTLNTGAFVATIPSGTPFALTQYESSPLNRVLSVTPPGWYASTTSYGSNASNDVKLDHANSTYYAATTLTKTILTEPGSGGASTGNKTITFKDKKGRIILVRRTDNAGNQIAETYNEYDDKDRLKLVIPPGSKYDSTGLNFAYTYDGADNILTKKVPDATLVTMKYNNRDQLALEQDGNLLALGKWRSIRYDDYGRPLKTGLFSGTIPNPILPTQNPTDVYSDNTYDGSMTIEMGKLKKARVRVFDATNTWLETNYTFDIYGRVSSTSGNNYLLPADLNSETMSYVYDFADHVLTETRNSKQTSTITQTIVQKHDYDAWGRLKSNRHQVNGGAEVTISDLNYNYKNELTEKNLGKVTIGATTGYLQSLDYTYNPLGWLQTINSASLGGTNVALSSCTAPGPGNVTFSSNPDNNDLFYLDLKYDVLQSGLSGTAQKNGNISQVVWRVRGRERQSYSLTFDYLDRLQNATYADITDIGTAGTNNTYRENLRYDSRGNILTLLRNGYVAPGACNTPSVIDSLLYTYPNGSNRLQKIGDNAPAATKAYGWNNTANAAGTAQYGYDANGNMISDPYKNMTVDYNFLNLPAHFSWLMDVNADLYQHIYITYDATGRKLRKKVVNTSNAVVYIQDYVNGIEYRTTGAGSLTLEAIYHSEGRVYNNGGVLRYEYSIRDHLGNTRLSFTDKNGNGVVDVTNTSSNEILQENHYYPFGMEMSGSWMNDSALDNQYKYNGKEVNGDFGLNWTDYGARWYDASIERWCETEPLSDCFPHQNSYCYAANNPINFVDLNGLLQFPAGEMVTINGKTKTYEEAFPLFTEFLKGGVSPDGTSFGLETFINNSSMITSALKVIGGFTKESIKTYLTTYGSGITVGATDFHNDIGNQNGEKNGETIGNIVPSNSSPGRFNIDINLLLQFENSTGEDRQAALLALLSTVLHESIHVGFNSFDQSKDLICEPFARIHTKEKVPKIIYYYNHEPVGGIGSEHGHLFERLIWHNGDRLSEEYNRKQSKNDGLIHQKDIIKKNKPDVIPKPKGA